VYQLSGFEVKGVVSTRWFSQHRISAVLCARTSTPSDTYESGINTP
jgi:hypothetical protein